MKKFLTVLLVIAVMFTFSFGSAFAAGGVSTDAEKRLIESAGEYAKDNFATTYEKAYNVVLSKAAATNAYITEDAWKAAAADVQKAAEAAIDIAVNGYINTTAPAGADWDDYPTDLAYTAGKLFPNEAVYTTLATNLDVDNDPYAVIAAKAQVAIDVKATIALYDLIDVDALYSKTSPTSANSYNKQAKAAIEAAKEAITDYFFDARGLVKDSYCGLADYDQVSEFKSEANFAKELVIGADGFGGTGFVGNTYLAAFKGISTEKWSGTNVIKSYFLNDNNIVRITDEETQDAIDAAKTAALKAQISYNVANYLKTYKTAEAKAFAEDYTTVYGFLAEVAPNYAGLATALTNDATAATMNNSASAPYDFDGAVKAIESLQAAADKYAAETDENGKLVRDAAAIAKLVKKATVYEYAKGANLAGIYSAVYTTPATYPATTAEADIKAMSVDMKAAYLAFQKDAKKAELADELDDILYNNYYDLEDEKVTALYEAAYAAIDAAANAGEIADAEAALDKAVAKINKKADVKALYTVPPMSTLLTDQKNALVKYVAYMNANTSSYKDAFVVGAKEENRITGTGTASLSDLVRNYYISQGVRTVAEMKEVTGVVEAVAATLPTVGDLEAAKKAAQDAAKALPSDAKITVADKDAIVAAYNLISDYKDMCWTAGVTATTIDISSKIDALYTAMQNDFNLAFAKADKTDKAALRTIASNVFAANVELYYDGGEEMFSAELTNPAGNTLENIRKAELKAVEKAINAIPVNVTEADKATVQKARELYDAYVADWTNVYKTTTAANGYAEGFALSHPENLRDLALAEAVLGLNNDPEENAKAYVQDLSIKARSVKTSKGVKITIKADVQQLLDDGFTVEYRFYRSTKSNKNFGKPMIVKSTNTYTNTKGVKGTRYYYKAKIVVKNAAGEVVATTPLTQCLYATRVF